MKNRAHIFPAVMVFLLLVAAGIAHAQQTQEALGAEYYNNKEYDKALAVFEELFNKSQNQFNYIYYVNTLIEIRDFDKAEKVVKKQMKAFPKDPRYQVDMGYLYLVDGETAKGKKIYENCLDDMPADKIQIYNTANAFATRRETDYLVRTYLRGRQLLKNPSAFAFELAYTYETLGNTELMLDEYINMLLENPQQMPTVQNRLQSWLSDDIDNSKNEAYRQALMKKLQKNPDEILYNELLLWHSIQQKDFPFALIQAKALDRRYNENGSRIYDLAALCVSNEEYGAAIDAYKYIIKKNADANLVLQSRIELLNTEFVQYQSVPASGPAKLATIGQGYRALLGELGQTSISQRVRLKFAHLLAFYQNETEEAVALLQDAILIPGTSLAGQAECKLELADIYLFTGEHWEATLLYSQVEKTFKNEPVGHLAKFKNAKLSYYIGEFGWAKAQLDVLKAATSKLIANDAMDLSLMIENNTEEDTNALALKRFAHAELLELRNLHDQAMASLDSIQQEFPAHPIIDDLLNKKAEICVKQGKYDAAATYCKTIVDNYSYDLLADDALFKMAQLYEYQLNNKDKAMQLYEEMLTKFPGSLYVVEARKHFRALRQDKVQ